MKNNFKNHNLECDVLVAGGGSAGVPAAIAAARAGAKVILCQDRPMLGGNASSEVRMHICGATHSRRSENWLLESRESGIIEEIRLENAVRNPQRSPSVFDLILYDKCRAEPNLTLYLNTGVQGVAVADGVITEAVAVRASTEDSFTIRASVFIDCTGDGTLGAAAGAEFIQGRESKAAYGESLAVDVADNRTLGSTLLFMARKHDCPMPFVAPEWARKFEHEDFRNRPIRGNEDAPTYEYGYWWIEWGGELDAIKDNEAIRDELLAIVLGVWDFVKNGGDHGADNWALDWFGIVPGKRESRRFIGQHMLTQNDLMEAPAFPDVIAYGGWPIDIHPPEGIDRPDLRPCVKTAIPYLYGIPLRSCISKNIRNLMFAGRNISATHVAFASTRVMATCALIGEGVGVAAAHAVRNQVEPAQLAARPEVIEAIKQELLREDNFLIGEVESANGNQAFGAQITASSEQPEGAAVNVVSGQSRSAQGPLGVRPDLLIPGSHRWMSAAEEGLPAWLQLRWQSPISFSRIELTFDTGLQRHLTLTHQDSYTEKHMIWGVQPETVKDFCIEVETPQGWKEIDRVAGNWQRRYKLALPSPLQAAAIRINVSATCGIDHARIVRVAVY